MKNERTPSYQFTTTDINDTRIKVLKDEVKRANQLHSCVNWFDKKYSKLRVRIMPRFGKNNPNRPKGWNHGWCQIKHATRFDVYIGFQ